jgi:PAS domain S-box-containing protein
MDSSRPSPVRTVASAQELSAAAVLASISDGFHLVDAEGRFLQFNDAAREMFGVYGIDTAAILGQPIATVFPDLEQHAGGRALLTCLRDRQAITVENYYPAWDRWYNVRHFPVTEGGVASFFQDITAQKRSQALLAEQRERFNFATDAAQIGYWFCDLPFAGMNWDARTKEHFFLPEDAEIDIHGFYQRLHPDDRERTRLAIEASIANGTRYDIEYRTVSPDGATKWIHAIGRTAYSKTGEPIRFDGTTVDITELKTAQLALRQSEAQFEFFANAIPALAWMARPDGWIFWFNQRWFEYTGTTLEQMQGSGWEAVHDPAMLPTVRERWQRALTTGEPAEMIFPLRGADGRFRHFLTRVLPVRNDQGEILHWIGTNTDVDNQRRSREALEAERRRWAAVFESTPIGLAFCDAAGTVISRNRPAEEILGTSVVSTSIADVVALYRPDGIRVERNEFPVNRSLATATVGSGEYLLERRDGSRIWIELTSAPILDASGALAGGVIAITDIDTRKRVQQALIRNEKLVVVGRMAASISHEINNPLESVTNLLYLIGETAREDSIRNYARMAQNELSRVSHIVTHTLRFNRQSTQAGHEELSELLDSALAIYTGRIQSAGITLLRDYQPTSPIVCFGTELRQVFANLIGNAFDATRRGGRIALRTRMRERNGQLGVGVTIADTGHGMDRGILRRLSEPFFTTKGDQGTGLGLWVSREILERHNARLTVWSSRVPGRSGSVFTLWFPNTAAPPRPADSAAAIPSNAG